MLILVSGRRVHPRPIFLMRFPPQFGSVLTGLAALFHLGKNPVDGPTASRVLADLELAGQAVEIFSAQVSNSFLTAHSICCYVQ